MRLIQEFSTGSEWGGAVLTAGEYAPPSKRGLYWSLPQVGVPAGLLLATIAILGVSQLSKDQFMSWEWRVPFLISVVLVAIGLSIRLELEKTLSLVNVKATKSEAKVPLLTAITTYPKQISLTTGSMISTGAYRRIANTYSSTCATTADTS